MDKETDLGFLPDRPFNPDLYPKEYKPSFFQKVFASIITIGSLYPAFYALSLNQHNEYLLPFAILILGFAFWYFISLRFVFGYSVILYSDKVEINHFSSKIVIPRNKILYFRRGGGYRNMAICLVTRRNKFYIDTTKIDHYVVTHGEFERDRDFFDWFNTLEAKTDFPLQRLREKAK